MSKHVAVKFNRPSTHGLTSTDTNNQSFTEFNLRAGVNRVPTDIWEKHEKHPIIQSMIDEGTIEVSKPKGGPEGYLATVKSPVEAIDAVKKTIDSELLQSWLKTEKRKKVVEALRKQLKDLATPPEIRDRSKTADEKLAEAKGGSEDNLEPDFSEGE